MTLYETTLWLNQYKKNNILCSCFNDDSFNWNQIDLLQYIMRSTQRLAALCKAASCSVWSWTSLCRIGYLAHEEYAVGAVLHNQNQERSVEHHSVWQGHGHNLYCGCSRCLCALLIHTEDCLMDNLEIGSKMLTSLSGVFRIFRSCNHWWCYKR